MNAEVVDKALFNSVVKLFVSHCRPWYCQPWTMCAERSSTSSGFIISNQRIVCNAHGVKYHTSIRIRKHGDAKKYNARIQYIAHECDFAILKVDDDQFWSKTKPLEFEMNTPAMQDNVIVIGYPTGGDNLSVTKGVVSRVELQTYSHSYQYLLVIQIDAAINPGNSGGPCIANNKVVGVAFSHLSNAENIGYCIPVQVIFHVLNDIKLHSKYTSFPASGFRYQKVENPDMKIYLKMKLSEIMKNDGKVDGNDDGKVDGNDDGKVDGNDGNNGKNGSIMDKIMDKMINVCKKELSDDQKLKLDIILNDIQSKIPTEQSLVKEMFVNFMKEFLVRYKNEISIDLPNYLKNMVFILNIDYGSETMETKEEMVQKSYECKNENDSSDLLSTMDMFNIDPNLELSGIMICRSYPLSDSYKKLKTNDVLLEVDNIKIGDDGTIPYTNNNRIDWNFIIKNKFSGDCLQIKILRNGYIHNIQLTIDVLPVLCPSSLYTQPITYFIFGGLVFTFLSGPYLTDQHGHGWSKVCTVTEKDIYCNSMKESEDEEAVVLARVLAHPINIGYHNVKDKMLIECNGVCVKNVYHLAQIIDNVEEGFVTFKFHFEFIITLDKMAAGAAMSEILKQHRITCERSPNTLKKDDEEFGYVLSAGDEDGDDGEEEANLCESGK